MTADERLLEELSTGSHNAFGQLFDTHSDYVFKIAYRRTGIRQVSEDIVGDVFAELWRKRVRLRPHNGSLRPWLAGVTTNKAHHYWRRTARERRALRRLRYRGGSASPDAADEVIARLDEVSRFTRLRDALNSLPTKQFDVLTLYVWEELTLEEIAEALGIAVGTAKSRLFRARQSIHQRLGDTAPVRSPPRA